MTIIERIKLNINIYCLNNDVEQVFVNFKNRRNAFTISFFFFFFYNLIVKQYWQSNHAAYNIYFYVYCDAKRANKYPFFHCSFSTIEQSSMGEGEEGWAKVWVREFTNVRVANPHRHNHKSKIIRSFALCPPFRGRRFERLQAPVMDFEEGREIGCFHCTRSR